MYAIYSCNWCGGTACICTVPFSVSLGGSMTITYDRYVMPITRWAAPLHIKPPKNWRWFHAFRTALDLVAHIAESMMLKPRCPSRLMLNPAQCRRHKRKRFVQALRSAM